VCPYHEIREPTTKEKHWLDTFDTAHEVALKSVFGSVIAGAFQITFRAEMHVNDVFLFFKNHF
jgi:hypothetical protein